MRKPKITLKSSCNVIYANAACLKALGEVAHAQMLVRRTTKELVIKPCSSSQGHVIRMRSAGKNPNSPRRVRCDDFIKKILNMMDWQNNSVYTVQGEIVATDNGATILFKLLEARL